MLSALQCQCRMFCFVFWSLCFGVDNIQEQIKQSPDVMIIFIIILLLDASSKKSAVTTTTTTTNHQHWINVLNVSNNYHYHQQILWYELLIKFFYASHVYIVSRKKKFLIKMQLIIINMRWKIKQTYLPAGKWCLKKFYE